MHSSTTASVGNYTFPMNAGNADQILTTDGAGQLRWDSGAGLDATVDAWENDATNTRVTLATLSNGTTARPQGTEVVFTDQGNLGIGTSNPSQKLEIVGMDSDVDIYSHGNDLTIFHLHAAGGTIAAPTSVATRNTFNISGIEAKAYNGANYIKAASIIFSLDGPLDGVGISDMPGKIAFNTTPDGAAFPTERMVIKNDGNIGIGITAPKSKLHVNGATSSPILKINVDVTLDNSHSTIIVTGGTPIITLPAANSCLGRTYILVNNTASAQTTTTYSNFGTSTTVLASNGSITIQSDGTDWYRIR